MLKTKRETPAQCAPTPTSAQYVDATAAAGRPITLRIDDRPALVVEDERACRLLWELVDRIETLEAVREGGMAYKVEVTEIAAAENRQRVSVVERAFIGSR